MEEAAKNSRHEKLISEYKELDIIQIVKYLYEIKLSIFIWVACGIIAGIIYTSINVYNESEFKVTPEISWITNLNNPTNMLNDYKSLIKDSLPIQSFIDKKHKHIVYHNIQLGPFIKIEFNQGLLAFQIYLSYEGKIDKFFLKSLLEKINQQIDLRNTNLFRDIIIFNEDGKKLIENHLLDAENINSYISKLEKLESQINLSIISAANQLIGKYSLKNNKHYNLVLENFCKTEKPPCVIRPAVQFDLTMEFLLNNNIINKQKYLEIYNQYYNESKINSRVNTALSTISNLYLPKFDTNKIEIDYLNVPQNQRKPQITFSCAFLGFIFAVIFNVILRAYKILYHSFKSKIEL